MAASKSPALKSPAPKSKSFRARLEHLHETLHWTIARLPFDPATAWPERRGRRVRGTINGFAFRTSLLPLAGGRGWFVVVNKLMQRGAAARAPDQVVIELEPDLDERDAALPVEFARIVKAEPDLRKWLATLSASDRREIGRFVGEPKSAASREKRAEQMAERLMLTMEGELETPPILKVAFQRQPLAQKAWQGLTATQRRRHLLGIFYFRTPEARDRRAQAAIEQAMELAERRSARKK